MLWSASILTSFSEFLLRRSTVCLLVCNGGNDANIDMVTSEKYGGKMLLIEDNGGGMDMEKMVDSIGQCFRIILRGKDVEHHNVVNDMMMSQEITYRPQPATEGIPKNLNMVATVTVGFVKDARAHIDVRGFNVYHKNRLIKPFWRVWHAPGSDGCGVIGVLEADFVEPAHDKQGFERTPVLSKLEFRLIQMQKTYWSVF
ncbi:Protein MICRORCHIDIA 7 [Salvia divinorum]|uniref:Protein MICRORCHIDIA 7 n=1 Tax=Salvia divinorum TaxID=28513 RepID=A0ABD1IF87_SALDI